MQWYAAGKVPDLIFLWSFHTHIPKAEKPWFFQCRPASPAAERGNGIILRSRVLQKVSTPRKEASPSEPIPVCRLRREFIVVE